jgi:hypothetical protein
MAYDPEVEAALAQDPRYKALLERLRRAVSLANLGASTNWPLGRRATYSLRLAGGGGTVSLKNPGSVRRAILLLENYKREA